MKKTIGKALRKACNFWFTTEIEKVSIGFPIGMWIFIFWMFAQTFMKESVYITGFLALGFITLFFYSFDSYKTSFKGKQ